ncbi:MAG: hypothetical protein JW981_11420 [Anaerolineae bacterium]|nr:hypothetical protein [Anaerolineae bacterium]
MFTQVPDNRHLERNQLSVLLAITLVSATLFRFIELPAITWGVRSIFGSPLNFSINSDLLLTFLFMGLVATGTLSMMESHPLREVKERPLVFSLITPTLGALLASLGLIRAHSWPLWLAGLLLSGVMIGGLIHLSYRAFSTEGTGYTTARTLLNIADYLIGFVVFSLILESQERALITGPVILFVSGLLALELLSASSISFKPVLLFGVIIAIIESEFAWVLGYWPISSWTAATLLTLILYFWTGLGYQYLLERLTLRVVVEFTLLAILMFVLVIWIKP